MRKESFFGAPESREALRDMYGDVRMLCDDVGLMNPLALLVWRMCKIDGQPSRYRGEPRRAPRVEPGGRCLNRLLHNALDDRVIVFS